MPDRPNNRVIHYICANHLARYPAGERSTPLFSRHADTVKRRVQTYKGCTLIPSQVSGSSQSVSTSEPQPVPSTTKKKKGLTSMATIPFHIGRMAHKTDIHAGSTLAPLPWQVSGKSQSPKGLLLQASPSAVNASTRMAHIGRVADTFAQLAFGHIKYKIWLTRTLAIACIRAVAGASSGIASGFPLGFSPPGVQ